MKFTNQEEACDRKVRAKERLGLTSKEVEAPSEKNTTVPSQTHQDASIAQGGETIDVEACAYRGTGTHIPDNNIDQSSQQDVALDAKRSFLEKSDLSELETDLRPASSEHEESSERCAIPGAYRVGNNDEEGSSCDEIYDEQESEPIASCNNEDVYVVCATAVDEEGENSKKKRLQELERIVQGLPSQKRRLLIVGSIILAIAIAAIVISVSMTVNKDTGSKQIIVTIPPSQSKTPAPIPEIATTSPPTPAPVPLLQNQTRLESWGIDRIDQEELPLDDTYYYRYTGKGVVAFIISTGILASHVDFHGDRASCGVDLIGNGTCTDLDGWGTMLAAIVGGSSYGVAKEVDLVAVRSFNTSDSGSLTAVINGIGYVKLQKESNPSQPMVALLPLGTDFRPLLNSAVQGLIRAGVVVVVPGTDCDGSPATVTEAITVGATTQDDMVADFSGTGPCIDIFAPGTNISTAGNIGTVAWAKNASGESYAAAHVAGVAALYLEAHPDWSPAQVWEAMQGDAAAGVLSNVGSDSPNLLVTTARLID